MDAILCRTFQPGTAISTNATNTRKLEDNDVNSSKEGTKSRNTQYTDRRRDEDED